MHIHEKVFCLTVVFFILKVACAYTVEFLKRHVDGKACQVSVKLLVHSVALYLSDNTNNIVQP